MTTAPTKSKRSVADVRLASASDKSVDIERLRDDFAPHCRAARTYSRRRRRHRPVVDGRSRDAIDDGIRIALQFARGIAVRRAVGARLAYSYLVGQLVSADTVALHPTACVRRGR